MVLLKEYICSLYFNVFISMKQITNTILMIRPVAFRMNEQTKVNNYFQEDDETAQSVSQFIMDTREIKVKETIRRKFQKN